MLGRKNYTQDELDAARTEMRHVLKTYTKLDHEPLFVNNIVLALDRRFVHRLRGVSGKDGNPLNEVELLVESLMNNDGILRGNNVIKYVPAESVLKLEVGDRISLTREQFERLSNAFLAEVEAKFV